MAFEKACREITSKYEKFHIVQEIELAVAFIEIRYLRRINKGGLISESRHVFSLWSHAQKMCEITFEPKKTKMKTPFEVKPRLIRKNSNEIEIDKKTIIDKQKHFVSLNWQDNNLEHAHSQTIIGFF